jgi:hypothetical protein
MKQILVSFLLIALVAAVVILVLVFDIGRKTPELAVNSFEECKAAGYPIMESYPAQCRTPEGRTFTEIIDEDEDEALVRVTSPLPNSTITSPLTVEGEARGQWYFEATFGVRLLDGNGNEIAETYAEAQGEWMTPEFVPFRSTVTFAAPQTAEGVLILEKANPSGLPEHAGEVRIPVRFSTGQSQAGAGACFRGGCSGEICSDNPNVASACIFKPEFACYQNARCERQANGQCGWTQTPELTQCLHSVS